MEALNRHLDLCKCNKEDPCQACYHAILTEIARMTVPQHLFAVLICLFNFSFVGIIVEFWWAMERLFRFGDYAPNGKFDQMGIDWTKPLVRTPENKE